MQIGNVQGGVNQPSPDFLRGRTSRLRSLRSTVMLLRLLLLVCALFGCAQGFVLPAARPLAAATACSAAPMISMTSADKKEKAKHIKAKSVSAATKRFKATATGKLLRRRPFKQHILTKKHPLKKQSLRKCAAPDCAP